MTEFVLADAGPLYAAVDPDDAHHARSLREQQHLESADVHIAISLPTLQETHGLILRKLGFRIADRWLQEIIDETDFFRVSDEDVFLAVRRIIRYADQPLSLVDGILAEMSERLDMPVWSYDHHMDVLGVRRWTPE